MTITLYHRTTEENARRIVANGFRDGEGYYGTAQLFSGVWVSNLPLDANEGACGNALIRIELTKEKHEIGDFEWIEEGKSYREWLIPAVLLNEFGKIEIQEIAHPGTTMDIALEAFAEADGDPERAIVLAREWVIVGPDGITEAEFKQLVIDRIWDLHGEVDEPR